MTDHLTRLLKALSRGIGAATSAYVLGMLAANGLADAFGWGVLRPAVLVVLFALTPCAFVWGARAA